MQVKEKKSLHVHRMLGPQRAIVVKGGDALTNRNKISRPCGGHLGDKAEKLLLGGALLP